MTDETASRLAARLAGSGIAAGAVASREVARLCGYKNAIGLDMGGTSADISLVYEGDARVTTEWFVEYGYPICFPSIEVLTIGAGGGSIAWIDEAGSLRNGPQSAGASPGPAAYGNQREQPTNTDANVVLGRLGESLVGGAMRLDRTAAKSAIQSVIAEPLGFRVRRRRGRSFVWPTPTWLMPCDSSHSGAGMTRAISRSWCSAVPGRCTAPSWRGSCRFPPFSCPPNPGIWSALGCLQVDIRHDLSVMLLGAATEVDPEEVEARFVALEHEARKLLSAEGVPVDDMRLERSIDMRYVGQWRSMTIGVGSPLTSLEPAVGEFHAEHERVHNYRRDEAPVEVYRLNLRALGAVEKAQLPHLSEKWGRNPRTARTAPRAVRQHHGPAGHPGVRPLPAQRGSRLRGSGGHRPVGLDHRGPTRCQRRDRRVAEHPDDPAFDVRSHRP